MRAPDAAGSRRGPRDWRGRQAEGTPRPSRASGWRQRRPGAPAAWAPRGEDRPGQREVCGLGLCGPWAPRAPTPFRRGLQHRVPEFTVSTGCFGPFSQMRPSPLFWVVRALVSSNPQRPQSQTPAESAEVSARGLLVSLAPALPGRDTSPSRASSLSSMGHLALCALPRTLVSCLPAPPLPGPSLRSPNSHLGAGLCKQDDN